MKSVLVFVAGVLCAACALRAESLAVFGKNQAAVVDANGAIAAVPDDPASLAFLREFQRHTSKSGYADVLPLEPPPEWGRTVPGSRGEVRFEKQFRGGFVARLALTGLAPEHRYLLTLNGTPGTPGNDLLADPVPGLPNERFYDFLRIQTDARGAYAADLGVQLKPGAYHVRIYVKDTADFKIVLYRDFFDFTVE